MVEPHHSLHLLDNLEGKECQVFHFEGRSRQAALLRS
ncbi:hypothetical protein MTR67_048949 [Solanum verrucosum]|uniref:Uncharacterized protein n=1 Tax=Solanum verrucosum TaxID=315347 RepID=A0AAF1A0K9_SOLVR|nr:hypothetical protein MTR67_048949 [Solanum verrucosum]